MRWIVLIYCVLGQSRGSWRLDWSDEFNGDTIDQDKWDIDLQDSDNCDKQNIGRLNCYTNSSRNIRLMNGTLALTAIHEKTMNKNFSSAWIRSSVNFTYGRIEVRAALPVGKLLSPWIKLVSPNFKYTEGKVRRNQVIVLYNDQLKFIRYGASLGQPKVGKLTDFMAEGNLGDFHTYMFEWNETDLIWKFDNQETSHLNVTGLQVFVNEPVTLSFFLSVGGHTFKNNEVTVDDVLEWTCSLFALDYVRYYRWIEDVVLPEAALTLNDTEQDKTSFDFCPIIMNEIRPMKDQPEEVPTNRKNETRMFPIISIVILVILMSLIPIIAWLVIRMLKVKDSVYLRTDGNVCDGMNQMEVYEQMDLKNGVYHEYNDIDQVNQRRSNLYFSTDEPIIRISKVSSAPERDYVEMVANLPRCGHSYLHVDY